MFRFKQFEIDDARCGMKLGTDSVALGAWTEIPRDARTALDIGAGSGILGLILAQRAPRLTVTALELEPEACSDCSKNFAASPWSGRLQLIQGDFSQYAVDDVDLIISNPPYFGSCLKATEAQRAVARHEGTLNYRTLIGFAAKRLSDAGSLAMILPAEYYDNALYHAEMARLKLRRLAWLSHSPDSAAIRVMMQLQRHDGHCHTEHLAVRSAEFAGLTGDFYL